MRIIHPSGECYDLPSETKLEFTRYNPFFNDLGEMSQPIRLPLTQRNKRLLGFPHRMDRRARPEDIDVIIDLGFASVPARQVIHTVDTQSADTTFYLNDGGLYARIAETPLKDVFTAEIIEFASALDAVKFCETLPFGWSGAKEDERFAMFEVQIDGAEDGKYKHLNERHDGTTDKLKGRNVRIETVNGKEITYPCGYGITPFVRVNYVLSRIAAHFGYTIDLGLFKGNDLKDMVLINTNVDSILDGRIHMHTLMPDVSVKEFLTAIRSRFCVEFYPDDITMNISVHFFRDIETAPAIDLTAKIAGTMTVEFPNFTHISLIAESVNDKNKPSDFNELMNNHPGIFRLNTNDVLYRGYETPVFFHPLTGKVHQAVVRGLSASFVEIGDLTGSCRADTTGDLTEKEVAVIGKIPFITASYNPGDKLYDAMLYAGAGRSVKSAIVYSDDTQDESSTNTELPVMTAFAGKRNKGSIGELTHYADSPRKYTLMPSGERGFFEQWWRYYAALSQNSLAKITVPMNLSILEKVSLSPMSKVMISNIEYIVDSISYSFDNVTSAEVTLYSLAEYEPAIPVPVYKFSAYPGYKWVMQVSYDIPGYPISELVLGKWVSPLETIYFENATEADYNKYKEGSNNYYQQRTYSAEWYRSVAGPNSTWIKGTATIGFQVKKA